MLQLARSRGWIVHAVCSAAQSARVLRLGAATVLDYRQDGWREIAARRAESQPLNAIVDMVSGEHAASLAPLLTANGHLVCIQDRQEKTPLPPFTTTISLHEVGLNAMHAHADDRQWGRLAGAGAYGEGYRIGPVRSSDYRRGEFRAASCGSCSVGAWSKSWQSCRGSIGGGILGRGVVIASQSFSLRLFHRINLW